MALECWSLCTFWHWKWGHGKNWNGPTFHECCQVSTMGKYAGCFSNCRWGIINSQSGAWFWPDPWGRGWPVFRQLMRCFFLAARRLNVDERIAPCHRRYLRLSIFDLKNLWPWLQPTPGLSQHPSVNLSSQRDGRSIMSSRWIHNVTGRISGT